MSAAGASEKEKVAYTANLLRRGATLTNEACPKCGGVQISFHGRTYCTNEDDLSSVLSQPATRQELPKQKEAKSQPTPVPVLSSSQNRVTSSERDGLKKLLEEKLETVSKQLEDSQNLDEQEKLLGLISKYLETLAKLSRVEQ